jgi:hypothetical protein
MADCPTHVNSRTQPHGAVWECPTSGVFGSANRLRAWVHWLTGDTSAFSPPEALLADIAAAADRIEAMEATHDRR